MVILINLGALLARDEQHAMMFFIWYLSIIINVELTLFIVVTFQKKRTLAFES